MRKSHKVIIIIAALAIAVSAVAAVVLNKKPNWRNRTHSAAIKDCYTLNKAKGDIEACIKKIPFDGDWGVPPKP